MGVTEEQDRAEMWNVEEIEREKEEEEYRLETVIVIKITGTLFTSVCHSVSYNCKKFAWLLE